MAVDFNQHAQLHKKINFGEDSFPRTVCGPTFIMKLFHSLTPFSDFERAIN